MNALAVDGSDLRRWMLSALLVLGVHAAGASLLLTWHDPVGVGEPSDAVTVDLEPLSAPPSDTFEDVAPGPKQEEAEAPPPERQPTEEKPDEKIEVPPSPAPAVAAVAPPEEVAPKPPMRVTPTPATTAPPRAHAGRAQTNKWYRAIVTRIQRNLVYPRAARDRGEIGVALLAFSIDQAGHVLSSSIAKSSGFAQLDAEAIAMVHRAQPFPAPPAGMEGAKFDFTVPVKFNIR